MKRNTLFNLLLALGLVLALGSGTMLARQILAQGPGPQGPLDVTHDLGTAFTYQGQLKQGGSPVNEPCEMAFRLYDDASAGAQVGSTITRTVVISDGLFTENLDFDSGVFTGDARWLGIRVKCTGDSDYADLGRQELAAVPYALYALSVAAHDHWGESWSDTSGTGLTLSGGDTGLRASGSTYGVRASGNTADLRLDGSSGVIYAKGEQQSDLKLYSNEDVDVHLDDTGWTPNARFRILDDADTAVFTVDENGAVSWATQTGYVSVSAAAFRPEVDGYDFTNEGYRLVNDNGTSDHYYAPVQLPHGATVTKMTFYWEDTSTHTGQALLRRNVMGGVWGTMA